MPRFDASIFGLIVADLIAEPMDLRRPPPPGGLALLNSMFLTTGGNVCNTGVAMAKLGMKVAAAGLVGKDVLGATMTERLRSAGVDTSAVFLNENSQTSSTVVAVEPGGERCFFHVPGVTALLDAAAFRQCIPVFAQSAFVQIGYFGLLPALTPDLPALLTELRRVAPQVKIALDTVNPPAGRELLDPILPLLDVFAPSRTEAAALTGRTDPPEMVAVLRRLMKQGLIGIKLDAQGCYLDDGAQAVTIPAYPVNVVDTTGAGDTWFGGLLTALIRGMPLPQAGRFANRAAADCCTALGASAGVKSFEQTLARL
ncbi:MAG TPA: carbohydrate kinase family protein [Tepidisphaeraceae bacterium]|nr:carbohydrate kinase family protein [Tepidisphaeraceae bacterium]